MSALAGGGVVLVAYLLGSLSSSYYIVRRLQGRDVRTLGSGNAGATNVLRAAGKGAGLATLALDVGKGVAAVALARAAGATSAVVYAAAVAVVVGHVFPVFLGFRGGKGVATGWGVMLVLAPLAAALAAVIFLAVTASTRYVALGSTAGAAACAPLAWVLGRLGWSAPPPAGMLVALGAVSGLIVVKHHDNLSRLRAGAEAQLGEDVGEGLDGERPASLGASAERRGE